ncbi:MAG: SpoIIE family protein phosphatase [Oscillospiraceae bacterium]|nr:SpoIIE family protein phosphatase [Oscillospiraceae bacterium]
MYYCCGITDKGRVRSNNEDVFLAGKKIVKNGVYEVELKAPFIVAAADGVAGEAAGEKASYYALKRLSKVKISEGIDYATEVGDIHELLKKRGVARRCPNMQTTLCALAVDAGNNAHVINAGDSRLYRYRNGVIKQLTTDQSFVQALYEQGTIAHEQKFNHAHKNIIFPVIGSLEGEPNIEVKKIEGGFRAGDILLLCTDGLSDFLTIGELEEALAFPHPLLKRVVKLAQKAADNGGKDNITALAVFRKGD